MSHYKIGLAVGADWGATKYHEEGIHLSKQEPGQFAVVALGPNGAFVRTWHLDSRAAAGDKFNQLVDQPDGAVYLSVFDKTDGTGQPYDESYLIYPVVNDRTVRRQSAAGWVAAGIAGLFGLMTLGKGKRHG